MSLTARLTEKLPSRIVASPGTWLVANLVARVVTSPPRQNTTAPAPIRFIGCSCSWIPVSRQCALDIVILIGGEQVPEKPLRRIEELPGERVVLGFLVPHFVDRAAVQAQE